ncbi:MAG TPA: GNAT family N-acetyltransferase [Candidatus Dormibacteraeota bacterium]|nr:GNAT family N-acetyltransferase [Candidatus Dormibacteraeota bacterium]
MISELTPVKVDPITAEADYWRRYHDLRRIRHADMFSDYPFRPDDVAEIQMKHADSFDLREYFEMSQGGVMVSTFGGETVTRANPEYETNKHLYWADAYVRPEFRRRGIATRWLTVLAQQMDQHGCTVVGMTAHHDEARAFLEWLGAEVKLAELESRLDLSTVDWALMERWVREGEERSPHTRLEIYDGGVPAELMEDFAVQRSTMLNTIPFDDLDVGKIVITPDKVREWQAKARLMGVVEYNVLTREPDGTISGMTDVEWTPYGSTLIQQQFTGVLPSARGRGIGKWIKAAMVLHMRERHPDARWITTENANSNAAMLKINRAMGFKPYRPSIEYQMSREQLGAKIRTL